MEHKNMPPPDDEAARNVKFENYDVALIITLNPTPPSATTSIITDPMCLHLKYWLIVTNRKDVFPRLVLERKLGMMSSAQARPFTAGKVFCKFFVF